MSYSVARKLSLFILSCVMLSCTGAEAADRAAAEKFVKEGIKRNAHRFFSEVPPQRWSAIEKENRERGLMPGTN